MLPSSILAKAHMPDLAKVVPAFNVESIEGAEVSPSASPARSSSSRSTSTGVFSPRCPASTTRWHCVSCSARASCLGDDDDGRGRFRDQRKPALVPVAASGAHRGRAEGGASNAGQLFKRLQSEMDESGLHTYPPGPWHAGLEPFPAARKGSRGRSGRTTRCSSAVPITFGSTGRRRDRDGRRSPPLSLCSRAAI